METDFILSASGYSCKFQGNKLLYGLDGMSLIAHTPQKPSTLNLYSLIVVTQCEEVEKLARDYNTVVVFNMQARKGQSFPIRPGTERNTTDQVVPYVAGQPYLCLCTFEKLLELADGEHIICVIYQGILRSPAVFPGKYYRELLALSDERGGKQILKRYRKKVIIVPCDVDEIRDIDKRSDLE